MQQDYKRQVHKTRAVGPTTINEAFTQIMQDPEARRRFEIEANLFGELTLPTVARLALTKG